MNIFPPVQIGIALPWFCTSSFSSLMGLKKTHKFIEALHIFRETKVSCVKFHFSFIW